MPTLRHLGVLVLIGSASAGVAGSQPPAPNELKPDAAAKVLEVPKDRLIVDGKLTKDDPPLAVLKGAPHQVILVKLHKGKHYVIDLISKEFDAFLILENAARQRLAYDDDSGGNLNSRLKFTAAADGVYRLLAASLDKKLGAFQLKVQAGQTPTGQQLALEAIALNQEALQALQLGRLVDAHAKFQQVLAMRRTLYPASKYPDGHVELSQSLGNLGSVLHYMGQGQQALPYLEQSVAMRRKLFPAEKFPHGHPDLATAHNNLAAALKAMGQTADALPHYEQSEAMMRKQYAESDYPDGHADLATCLNNLGSLQLTMGSTRKAMDYYRESLAMRRKLFPESTHPDGHPEIAASLTNLGGAFMAMGEGEKALTYHEQGLEMRRRVFPKSKFPNGHPELAAGFHNMGGVINDLGQPIKAVNYFDLGLQMQRTLYPAAKFPNGHPEIAQSLHNLATTLRDLGDTKKALTYYAQSWEMRRKLYPESRFPDGHPSLAASLNNLANIHRGLGQTDKAMSFARQNLEMCRKLFPESKYPNGHSQLATAIGNLGNVFVKVQQADKAVPYCQESLAMTRRLYPREKYPEGLFELVMELHNMGAALLANGQPDQALTYIEQALAMQHGILQRELATASEAAALARIAHLRMFTRHYYLSAALPLPDTAARSYDVAWLEKGIVQRLLARRHLAAAVQRQESLAARKQFEQLNVIQQEIGRLLNFPGKDLAARDRRLTDLSDQRERLQRELAKQIPILDRDQELSKAKPKDLLERLPAQSVLIDFLSYTHVNAGLSAAPRYLAFILAPAGASGTKSSIQRIDLGPTTPIDAAIAAWAKAIEGRTQSSAAADLAKLVWEPVSKHLPPGTTTLYLAPDGELSRVPWAALPTSKDRILLEDYVIAQVPNGPFLLEQLKYPGKRQGPGAALALGDIAYQSPVWPELPATVVELKSLAFRAPLVLAKEEATAARVLAELPKVHYAHFATHGFFDAAALSAEKKREAIAIKNIQLRNDTRKEAAKNPLGFTGLVLSKGEVLTGLALVDLPLENLRLATLSACETGLGEITGGEGVQGLQRAFHIAGCPNVVASLWKVNDAATAALMAKFYHELWVNHRPPIEALREAQLTIYRHPELIPDLAGERGAPKLKEAVAVKVVIPSGTSSAARSKVADTRLWAAFVLSGAGR